MKFLWVLVFMSGPVLAQLSQSKVDGPNCLNTALLYNHIVSYPRYTSNTEMGVILQSELCSEVLQKEERKPGDINMVIGTLQTRVEGIYSHAYVYVNDGMMFEKVGYSKDAPYHYISEQEIFDDYEVGVASEIKTYRCRPLDKNKLSFKASSVLEKMEGLEKDLFEVMDDPAQKKKADIFKKTNALIPKLAQDLLRFKPEDFFVKRFVLARMVSVSHQLANLGDNTLRKKTVPWELSSDKLENLALILAQTTDIPRIHNHEPYTGR